MRRLIFFLISLIVLLSSCNTDDEKSFQNWLNDRTEKWLDADLDGYICIKSFDEKWINNICKKLKVCVKMLKALELNDKYFDFAYQATGIMSFPKINIDKDIKLRAQLLAMKSFLLFHLLILTDL